MALKDLVASKATLREADIEEIVAAYVVYDTDHGELAFTPAGTALPSRKKVLVYLVALQGWPFVAPEVSCDAAPGDIVEQLGLPGGTVRPLLMALRDQNLVVAKDGRYCVRPANLHSIKAELKAEAATREARVKRVRKERKETEKNASGNRRSNSSKSGSQSAKFEGWIEAGYFDQPRTLGDVRKKFHQAGVIIAVTSIPQLLLKAVRAERLSREEAEIGGKRVWVYTRQK